MKIDHSKDNNFSINFDIPTIPASVYIITFNEENNIKRALLSVKDFAEVIIVDSNSNDKTLEFASEISEELKINLKIFSQSFLGYASQKQFALEKCSYEWVLNLDADEELSVSLKEEIKKIVNENVSAISGLSCKIADKTLWYTPHKWSFFIERVRFFRKSCGYYEPALVHESITIKSGKVIHSQGTIHHYGAENISYRIKKLNYYSDLAVEQKIAANRKISRIRVISEFFFVFLKSYVIRRGFLNGMYGFYDSITVAFYAFMKVSKLYFYNKGKPRAKK